MVDDFGEGGRVQDNLVTKNGEVEKELEKMRMLMLRVERGMEGLDRSRDRDASENMDWEESADQALQAVLK